VDVDGFTMSGNAMTFALSVKSTQSDDYTYLLDFNDDDISNNNRFIFAWNGNVEGKISYFDNGAFYDLGDAPNDDSFHRLVFTINGNTIKLYVDSVLQSTKTTVRSIDISNSLRAKLFTSYSNGGSFFNGTSSDIQIYDSAWQQSDVTFDYNNPNHLVTDNPDSTIALSNLKGYWALSEGDGSIAYDSSGEGNNGAINGATYILAQPTIPQLGMVDWAKSTPVADEITLIQAPNNKGFDILGNPLRLREHAFNLDGSGYAEVADDDSLDMNEGFSVSFWRKLDVSSDGVRSAVLTKGVGLSTGIDFGFALSMFSNKLNADINTSVGRFLNQTTLTIDGRWVFVTFTYTKNDKSRVYIDDNETPTMSPVISGTINETHPIRIGTDKDLAFKDSTIIDEVVWYNRALTQKEITQNYKAGINKHKATSSFSDDFSSDYGI